MNLIQPFVLGFELLEVAGRNDRHPPEMLLRLGILLCIVVQSPVVYETNRTEMLVKKRFLFFRRVKPELITLNHT